MAEILCVLFPDPTTGYPPTYARDHMPVIKVYPNGQTVPSPRGAWTPWRSCRTSSKVGQSATSISSVMAESWPGRVPDPINLLRDGDAVAPLSP